MAFASAISKEQVTLFEVREMWDVLSLDERMDAFEPLNRTSAREFPFMLSQRERAAIILHNTLL